MLPIGICSSQYQAVTLSSSVIRVFFAHLSRPDYA